MLDARSASCDPSTTPCAVCSGTGASEGVLTVAQVSTLRGSRGPSAAADLRTVQRMVRRWRVQRTDPTTGTRYPTVHRRVRPCGGVEWLVELSELRRYMPAWFRRGSQIVNAAG